MNHPKRDYYLACTIVIVIWFAFTAGAYFWLLDTAANTT